ncbi:MAG: hypothetical protein Q8Q14_14620, partial [Gemmatimonadales bacterium]|nr:hypothetical protein [Gemmatimonadales bacterium]
MITYLAALLVLQAPDSAVFITRLGADTLVVERMIRRGNRIEAEVLLRVPRTTRTQYTLELSPSGELLRMESVREGRRELVTRAGDSLRIAVVTDSGRRERAVAADARTLPFIEMVHWPYEVALRRLRTAGG